MGICTHSYVWIGLQACNKCLNSSHVKSQMTPGFGCAIFSEDSYLQEEVKLHHSYINVLCMEDFLLQPFSSHHYPEVTCAFTPHSSVPTALCPKGFPTLLPPPFPTHVSRPYSDITFSPTFAFTCLLKG